MKILLLKKIKHLQVWKNYFFRTNKFKIHNNLNLKLINLNLLLKNFKKLYINVIKFDNFIVNFLKNLDLDYKNKNQFNFVKNLKHTSLNFTIFSFKYDFLLRQLFFWTSSWLSGAISNFFGLKKSLKTYHKDFYALKSIPHFVVLFNSKKSESFIEELSNFSIPVLGFSDISMNPFFFHYYIPSNVKSIEGLFFFFRLILESFFRGFLKDVEFLFK